MAKAPELTPMEASDRGGRGGRLAGRITAATVAGSSRPRSSRAGWTPSWLDQVAASVDDGTLEGALRWLNYTVETELLMNEIEDSTTRISTLVAAAKQYSQLDRAPFQVVDVHELLESTLMMLSAKIGDGITVVKDYDRSLPPIPAYAAELNQVWTNLIDNAVSAMDGHGTLTVRTARDDDWVLVEIGDTGPGVPAGDPGADLRAVLHHQAGRRGHRARAGHLVADRGQQAPRRPAGGVGARRHPVPGPAAARPRPRGAEAE